MSKKNLDGAIAMMVVHAENCEGNAVIAGEEGRYDEKAHYERLGREYREAVKVLKAGAK